MIQKRLILFALPVNTSARIVIQQWYWGHTLYWFIHFSTYPIRS